MGALEWPCMSPSLWTHLSNQVQSHLPILKSNFCHDVKYAIEPFGRPLSDTILPSGTNQT